MGVWARRVCSVRGSMYLGKVTLKECTIQGGKVTKSARCWEVNGAHGEAVNWRTCP